MKINKILLILILIKVNWSAAFQAVFSEKNKILWEMSPENIDAAYLCSSDKYFQPQIKYSLNNQCNHLIKLQKKGTLFHIEKNWPKHILQSALQIIVTNKNTLQYTRIKILDVLDDLYAYDGQLGQDWSTSKLRLWAPTAKQIKLHLYDQSSDKDPIITKLMKSQNGVWETHLNRDWKMMFYLFEITIFDPYKNNVVNHHVTDPYSTSLSVNSEKSQIIDLNDSYTRPSDWDSYKRAQHTFENSIIYELHIRDFSMHDQLLANHKRGKYLAFCEMSSHGNRHLRRLKKSGLTHVHLLPFFDIASINENFNEQHSPKVVHPSDPTSPSPQELINKIKDHDGFNWGYDPYHFGVVEGSYSSNANGFHRILEARQMIQCLHKQGLSVVMDVVYNHTFRASDDPSAVLDKIVPAYYYRTDSNLRPHQSTCCPDTASERQMMQKLMVDTILRFARDYHIDGFRFDLMGHHTKQNLLTIRKNLDSLPQGRGIIIYGEGWAFGSLQDKLQHLPMNQNNAAGSGIGTFNDRMRDSIRGGNFMHSTLADQGWTNGLFDLYSNQSSMNLSDTNTRRKQFEELTDLIRLGIAGNLANYPISSFSQGEILGSQLNYGGKPGAGYSYDPQESINYVSAHDNYTLWDQILAKAPVDKSRVTTEQRLRMQLLALATVNFSQGIPFFHAGSEILRSKSGDGDSYNSGDYFNKLDFSYTSNNWGIGLPIKEKNYHEWDHWKSRLKVNQLKVSSAKIKLCLQEFLTQLNIRSNYNSLRMTDAESIITKVKFLNASRGKLRVPGLIVVYIQARKPMIIALNPLSSTVNFNHPKLEGNWRIVPELKGSFMSKGFSMNKSSFSLDGLSYVVLTL